MQIFTNIENKFKKLFNKTPIIVCSSGRVNLIGEHTDYNKGFVLPAAIDKSIYFAVLLSNDNICRLYTYDMNDKFEFRISGLSFSQKV